MESKFWSEFQYTNKNGLSQKFIVRDYTEDRFDEVFSLYYNVFFIEESIQKLSGIPQSEDALNECKQFIVEMLKEPGMSIVVCVEQANESSGKVVGVSSMKLNLATDNSLPDVAPETKEVRKLFEMIDGMAKLMNVPNYYSAEKWYDGRGIVVHPDYRGFGIGSMLVQSRRKICKDHGVHITSAWMTSIGTQKGAQRDGWETPFEIDTKEFVQKFDVKPYDGIPPTFKVMVAKV